VYLSLLVFNVENLIFFTGPVPFVLSNQQPQSTEGKSDASQRKLPTDPHVFVIHPLTFKGWGFAPFTPLL